MPSKKKIILITGGAVCVGHHLCEHFLRNTGSDIVVLDKLTYAAKGFDRLRDIKAFDDKRVLVLSGDFSKPLSEGIKQEIGNVDYIFHIGAESHVDNSIIDPEPFVHSNVLGTMHMLNFAREVKKLTCFFYFSTDEVFGPAPEGVSYKEDDAQNPSNPYSATKSGGEMLVKSYRNTYRLPCTITRSMNIFGERQHPEKFIPMVAKKIMRDEKIYVHSNANKTKAGSRFYIHARNVADGYMHLLNLIESGKASSVVNNDFHITGEKEVDNLEMVKLIAKILGKENYKNYELVDFHSSRPGHDLRYALDGSKMESIGWKLPKTFDQSLTKTIEWMVDKKNARWMV